MPTTPIYGLPYPTLTDVPNGPAQLQALAEATETALQAEVTDLESQIAAAIGGSYRATTNQGSISTGVQTRLNFGSAYRAANGITWQGTPGQFTVTEAGLYSGSAFCRVNTSGGFYVTLAPGGWGGGSGQWGGPSYHGGFEGSCSFTEWLDVGATVSAWVYTVTATTISNTTKNAIFQLWKVGG